MKRSDDLYCVESEKSVARFVTDFDEVIKKYGFIIGNPATMNMKETFDEHGGTVSDDFDLHMIQVCKPTKADASLTANLERSILIPKFVMVFSKEGKTQIRYMSFSLPDITELVPNDPQFPESLVKSSNKIRSMIDEAK